MKKKETIQMSLAAEIGLTTLSEGVGRVPVAHMSLTENHRPAFALQFPAQSNAELAPKIVWIPTVERMLEDALVMIALYVEQDREVIRLAKQYLGRACPKRVELYRQTDAQVRELFYTACRAVKYDTEGDFLLIDRPTFASQWDVLQHYNFRHRSYVPTNP
jgi:hypothetical protein